MALNLTTSAPGTREREHLIEKLRNAIVTQGGKCVLAVDPALRALEDNSAEGAFFTRAASISVPVANTAFAAEKWPRLIELDLSAEPGMALFTQSVRIAFADREPESVARGRGQRIGGWLVGASSVQDVADHWTENLLSIDDQGRRCVLRFYDARVLALMWPVLMPMQRRRLLGPVQTWYALDQCAELTAYVAPGRSQSRLEFDDTQWVEFHRHGVINRALALFMNEVGRQPELREVQSAVQGAARAEQHGLKDPDDRIAFVGHVLAWHPQFDAHPAIAPVLGKVSQGALYCAAVSELDPRVVSEIQRGTWFNAA